ncbi:MAG: hemerythrin domain-containing protein [Myxococcota bacterium]
MSLFSRIFSPLPDPKPAQRPTPARPAAPASSGPGLAAWFTEDHGACDRLWAAVEGADDDADAFDAFRRFDAAMRRHLGWEEDTLFPAFEVATGHVGFGPTYIMRSEHEQMRAVLDQMAGCVTAGDRQGVLDQGDTLMMLVQQHNAKEEGMLYPMAEQALGDAGWAEFAPRFSR